MYGPARVPAVLGVVVGPLQVVHRRADVGEPAEVVDLLAQRRERRDVIEREVDLRARALEAEALDVLDQVVRQLARLDELEERAAWVERRDDGVGVELRAVLEGDPGGPTVPGDDVRDRRLQADLGAERLGRPGEDLGEPAVALLVERPRAELAVVLADRVVEQDEAGALRARPDLRADDARRGEIALEQVRLEVVVEEVRGRSGQQPDGVVEDPLVELLEPPAQAGQRDELLGVVAEDVRRDLVEQRLERLADHLDVVAVLVVRVGVVLRMPPDLLEVLGVVLGEQQVVAVLARRERRRHQQRHEAVLGQLQVVDDLRPQQAQRVRERGEPEAGSELLGDGRAADEVAPLEDERLEAGLGQVGAVDQAVVPAADDDGVVRPVRLRGRLRRLRRAGRLGGAALLGRGLRCSHRHVRPSFAPGCRAAAGRHARRPARSDGRP